MNNPQKQYQKTLFLSIAVVLIIVCLEILAILYLNSGHFTYTIDDTYIHLAMAENIHKGFYGINPGEYSSPSSSIIWPFLLEPFIQTKSSEIIPLIFNLIPGIGILFLFNKILVTAYAIENHHQTNIILVLLILLVLATNLIGLIFTGMEQTLQVFCVVIILYGLISESQNHRISPWLSLAIIIAPLVRYENLAVSFSALGYLLLRGYYKLVAGLACVVIILVGGFSFYLHNLGLEPLPMSVLVKSPVIGSGRTLVAIYENLLENLNHRSGTLLVIGFLILIFYALSSKLKVEERMLASSFAVAIVIHIMFGRQGSFNRYEIYIWTATMTLVLYLSKEWLWKLIRDMNTWKFAIAGIFCTACLCSTYMVSFFLTPIASNNIYEQQYQMHRFAVDYYQQPVAVNDIGYVSYQNEHYVLDLWGISSREAYQFQRHSNNPEWMNRLTVKNDVHLVMIYDLWFPKIPTNWEKVAELHLGKLKISPAASVVSFYTTERETNHAIKAELEAFQESLPEDVRLVIITPGQ